MPRHALLPLLTLLPLALLHTRPDGRSDDADRAAIRAHIDSIFRAYIEHDRATVEATHSPDWCGFLSGSPSILRSLDDYMARYDRRGGGGGGMTGYEMLECEVRLHGDTAVVPYVARVDALLPGDVPVQYELRVLDVYAKRDGEWIQVASDTELHPDTLAELRQLPSPLDPGSRAELLAAREAVWRAWFAHDEAVLDRVLPPETLAVGSESERWSDRDAILAASAAFAAGGGRLVDLDFPETEVQLYGDVAILYTTYELELEVEGQPRRRRGHGTEVFVRRAGVGWVNPGWSLAELDGPH